MATFSSDKNDYSSNIPKSQYVRATVKVSHSYSDSGVWVNVLSLEDGWYLTNDRRIALLNSNAKSTEEGAIFEVLLPFSYEPTVVTTQGNWACGDIRAYREGEEEPYDIDERYEEELANMDESILYTLKPKHRGFS